VSYIESYPDKLSEMY